MRTVVLGFVAATLLTGCASEGAAPIPSLAQQRGYALAQRQCALCHAVADENARIGAPSFLSIARRYNDLTFRRRIKEIGEGRHGVMPPLQVSAEEADDLAAYIAALAVTPAPCTQPVEKDRCAQ